MKREWITQYSRCLNREMHLLVYGWTGTPMLAFPCQDGMCDNWGSFAMPQTLENELNAGTIQLFCVDTVDRESFSDQTGDPVHRAAVQEQYYRYVVEEALPLIRQHNGTGRLPVATGFSLGASHAAICFFRRPELFSGVLGLSGCYDSVHFWNGWCNGTLYDNSPVHFLANMPPRPSVYLAVQPEEHHSVCRTGPLGRGMPPDNGQNGGAVLSKGNPRMGRFLGL